MSTEPFGPWVQPMIKAGAVDPRREEAVPSWNRLAEIAHVSTSTVTGMVAGTRGTSPATVQKIAAALRVDPVEVSEWLKLSRPVGRRYVAPPEADLLTEREQKALSTFIRAIAAERQEEGSEHGQRSAKKIADVDAVTTSTRLEVKGQGVSDRTRSETPPD